MVFLEIASIFLWMEIVSFASVSHATSLEKDTAALGFEME